MRIDQVLVAASPGDAVTNATFALRGLLRRVCPSDIYARFIDPRLSGDVLFLGSYQGRAGGGGSDVLIYHASIGEPEVAAFLLERRERLALVYHNITPPEYFAVLQPGFAQLLTAGRAELGLLRKRVKLALAVSAYNAAELEALGYDDVRVSPLAVEFGALRELRPHPATVRQLARDAKGPVVLFVGQLLPHKRPDLLLQAFHVLTTYLIPEAHLVLVGPTRLEPYRRALEDLVGEMKLDAHITGWVSDAELAAFYRAATCFVTLSEHEGVCVPLLEAMAFDVPVIARAFAAVPETMGEAGILLPPDDDPVMVAEAISWLASDESVRGRLVAQGRARLRAFDPEAAQATFLSHLSEVV
jgi:glycosyltransferase involved in cell wall biosynthesis